MSMARVASKARTPFDRIGGREPIGRMVERFYDLMDSNADYAPLRAMHRRDLAPMKESLADFLMAWMGGPRDWFDKNPGACIMSAHGGMDGMSRDTAQQWISAMTLAATETVPDDPEFIGAMLDAMASMCRTMAQRAEDRAEGITDVH